MSKTLIVGDLHGRSEIAEKALATDYFVIFIGDYLDSFDRKVHEQTYLLNLVLNSIRKGRAYGLLGNHEMSYLDSKHRCSGWRMEIQAQVDQQFWVDMKDLLKSYIWHEGFLLTHAGVSQWLLNELDIDLETYLESGNFDQIGRYRGGMDNCGGLYWCDWYEEFDPIDGVKQIVGHSGYRWSKTNDRGNVITPRQYDGVIEMEGNYNVDCYQYKEEFLVIEDGNAEIITL